MARIDPQADLPDPATSNVYTHLYNEIYRRLYPDLRDVLNILANLSS